MDYKEALEYINGTQWFGSKPGLARVGALLEKLGRPQDGMKFIHVAGTNGKGSCSAMLASVLKAAGYKTGLFTSPYLSRFNERMRINGKEIGDEALAAIVSRVAFMVRGGEVRHRGAGGRPRRALRRDEYNRSAGGRRDNEHRP